MEQNLNLYHILYGGQMPEYIRGGTAAFISQPAISKAISRLEQNLNTTLFLRSSRGVRLTETGNPFRQVGMTRRHLPGRNSCEGAELGMGHLSIGVSQLCAICTASLSQPFYQGKSAYRISIPASPLIRPWRRWKKGLWISGLSGE
ncbi:MAG: LysR family transcriptional regulator [Eisenbergiella sp.]